jgi:hypothetical protein
VRTNLKRRLRATAGISVALTTAALSVALAAPASATETDPDPTPAATPTEVAPTTPAPPAAPVEAKPGTAPGEDSTTTPETDPKPETSPGDQNPSPEPEPTEEPEEELNTVTVTGKVWRDKNRNGIQDAGEPGIKNVPVVGGALPEELNFCDLLKEGGDADKALDSRSKAAVKGLRKAAADPEPSDSALTDAQGNYTLKLAAASRIGVLLVPVSAIGDTNEFDQLFHLTKPGQGTDRSKDSDFAPCAPVNFDDVKLVGVYDAEVDKDTSLDVDGGLYLNGDTAPSPSASPAPGGGGDSLPNTGLAIGGFVVAGTLLVGGGAALTILARRRRQVI